MSQPWAACVFDMDGTIYLGDELLPGARRVVEALRQQGVPVRFLSNNPTRTPEEYAARLTRLGIPTDASEVANTVVTTVRWLQANHPDAVVFPIAEQPLVDALHAAGFRTSDDASEVDVVISSYDRGFDYAKLQVAFDSLWFHRRAILVETNPDRYCPYPGGRGEPDCAAITAAITASTGVELTASLGKPSPLMLAEALRGLDVRAEDCLMVGDRLHTDIAMAKVTGMSSALVLTGDSTREDVAALAPDQRPDLVFERIDELLSAQR